MSVAVNLCARSFLDSQLLDDIPELLAVWKRRPLACSSSRSPSR